MQTNSSGEIDLLTILNYVKKWVSNLFRAIGGLISFSIQNIKTLFLFIFICVSISLGLFFTKKKVYSSELIMSHHRLNNIECYATIQALTELCDNSNYKQLAKKLNTDPKTAQQLKSILYLPLNSDLEDSYRDSAEVIIPFKIQVQVYEEDALDSLQAGILRYLESNDFVMKRKIINDTYLDKFEEKIKKEIFEIDSLKQIVNKSIIPRGQGNGIILGEPIDPIKVYMASIDLYKVQLNIDQQKELNNSFEVIVGFSPARATNSMTGYISYGIIAGLLSGFLWLFRKKNAFSEAIKS